MSGATKPLMQSTRKEVVKVPQSVMATGPKVSFENTSLLCIGYLRYNFISLLDKKNINPFDISTIVIKMIGIDMKKCIFYTAVPSNQQNLWRPISWGSRAHAQKREAPLIHDFNTVIFNNKNLTHQQNNFKTLCEQYPINVLSIKRIPKTHSCKHPLYTQNKGYAIQCGIIEVPKSESSQIAKLMLQPPFYQLGTSLINLSRKKSSLNVYYLYLWYYKYDLERYWCSFGINTQWDKKIIENNDLKSGDEIEFCKEINRTMTRRKGKIENITRVDDKNFDILSSNWRFCRSDFCGGSRVDFTRHFIDIKWDDGKRTQNVMNRQQHLVAKAATMNEWHGINWGTSHIEGHCNLALRSDLRLLKRGNINYNTVVQAEKKGDIDENKGLDDGDRDSGSGDDVNKEVDSEVGMLNEDDTINIVINNQTGELYFYKNDNKNKKIGGISQKLDFEKYKYYFAMSSITCACDEGNKSGFQYDVSVHL